MGKIKKLASALTTLLIAIIVSHIDVNAKPIRVQVGDLFYEISGTNASVTTSDVIPISCRNLYPSKYTKDIYIIPSHITYNGLEYEVTEIGRWAFAGFRNSNAEPVVRGATGSTAHTIILPPTIKRIGESAFANCTNLVKMIIPPSVESIYRGYYDYEDAFYNTPLLRELIYLSATPPSGWKEAPKTYVPNVSNYGGLSSNIMPILSSSESSFVYSGEIPTLSLTCNIENSHIRYNTPVLEKNVGSYDAIIDVQIENEYSYETSVIVPYNINPVDIIVSTSDVSREYGDPNPEFMLNYDGFVNDESLDVLEQKAYASTSAKQTSNVGQYPITISGAKAKNYTFSYISGELTILPAPLSANVKSISREYGNTYPMFALNFKGLKNGETEPSWTEPPIFNTAATSSSSIGEYPVTATAKPKNYKLSFIADGILTITPAKLKVIVQNKQRLYYEENPELTYTISGFKNGDDISALSTLPELTTNALITSNVGEYEIKAEGGVSTPNYEMSYKNGILSVNPRTLSVSVGSYERVYGAENPEFVFSYDGFVAGDTEKDLKKLPTATTSATKLSHTGSYPIYITGGEALNYKLKYITGQLNIVKAEQNIIWNQDLSGLATGQQVELLAYSTSGLPVTYNLANNDICELYSVGNTNFLDCIGEGEIYLRVSQEGNSDYYSTQRNSKKVVVSASSLEKPILTLTQHPVGSISSAVEWGSVHTFTIQTNPEWSINAISINGKDYTDLMDKNGTFTTPTITQNTTIIISYENENSSVNSVEQAGIKILGQEHGIKILNAPIGKNINIYTVDGFLIKSIVSNGNDDFITLQNNKTYIVKVEGYTGKVRL